MSWFKTKKVIVLLIVLTVSIIAFEACETYYFRSNYDDVNELIHETENLKTKPFLKAHLKNGDICIFRDTWIVDSLQTNINGKGVRFDFNRNMIHEGKLTISIDSVLIFETNEKLNDTETQRIATLAILAGVDVIIGIVCITTPKACFGSCPTFYMNEDEIFHYADAEGFSNAISPSLEYYDIDALNSHFSEADTFAITMKNEALETHCVKDVKLMAYPINDGERVYHTRNYDFYLCENNYPITSAISEAGEIKSLVEFDDKVERFSLSDENNLKSKEEIILTFDDVVHFNDLALIVDFRQTLMTTYMIYNAISYMGNEVSDIFAGLESNQEMRDVLSTSMMKELGKIDIYLWDELQSDWIYQGDFYETGPIAINKQILPIKNTYKKSQIKLKIELNRGLWRIDYLALTNIKKSIKPEFISPSHIYNKGDLDNPALNNILDNQKYLVSMPGEEFKFVFDLPESDKEYDFFLYSKGYYLEWMREDWVKDKDLLKLNQIVNNPEKYLIEEAENYKKYEESMEEQFWDSRIDTKKFSYYEN